MKRQVYHFPISSVSSVSSVSSFSLFSSFLLVTGLREAVCRLEAASGPRPMGPASPSAMLLHREYSRLLEDHGPQASSLLLVMPGREKGEEGGGPVLASLSREEERREEDLSSPRYAGKEREEEGGVL